MTSGGSAHPALRLHVHDGSRRLVYEDAPGIIPTGTLRVVVAEVVPLAEAARAYERRRGGPAGKTAVRVRPAR